MSPPPDAEPRAASPASASVSGAAASDALSAKVAGIQLSRRRPDFFLPPMHRDLRLSSHAPLEAASAEGGGARVDGEKVVDEAQLIAVDAPVRVSAGKKHHGLLTPEG